ncbi:MAG TPA: hypothetical protein VM451_05630 [Candidatus Limnocylindria bacterium]|nr:hypothetical protein [Candidatus Limnocylindria bacterium]
MTDDATEPAASAAPAAEGLSPGGSDATDQERPLVERIGLGAIALVFAGLFGAIGIAALGAGELFLGVMASIGALMTLWAAASTLRRG